MADDSAEGEEEEDYVQNENKVEETVTLSLAGRPKRPHNPAAEGARSLAGGARSLAAGARGGGADARDAADEGQDAEAGDRRPRRRVRARRTGGRSGRR